MLKDEKTQTRTRGRLLALRRAPAVMTTPVVPRYTPTAKPADLSTPVVPALGADTFGAGLGEGLRRVTESVAGMIKETQDKANASVVMQASNSSYVIEEDLSRQAKELTGKSAFGSTDVLLRDFDERNGKIRMGLASDVQREAFDKLLVARRHAFASTILDHELKQTTGYTIGEATAATEGAAQRVGLYHDRPELFEAARQEMERNARAEMLIKGSGPDSEATKLRLTQLNSKVYEDQVQAQLVKDPAAAQVRYQELKASGVFQGDAVERLEPKIQAYVDTKTAEDQGAAIFSKYLPQTVNDVLPVDKMRQEARAFEGSDHVRVLIEKRVEGLASDYLQQKRLNEESASQRIYGLGENQKTPYLQLVREINGDVSIDNRTKASLLDWADRTYGVSEAKREARAEAKAEARMQKQVKYLARLFDVQNAYLRGDYGTMTPQDVAKFTSQLGPVTDDFMRFVDKANNDPAAPVGMAKLKGELRILRGNKDYTSLIPDVDSTKDVDKAKLALLNNRVMNLMTAAKKAGPGQEITLNQAILQALRATTTDEGFFSDTKEPAYVIGTPYASKHGKDPSRWPRKTQEDYVRQQFYLRNPKGNLTPEMMERMIFVLKEGASNGSR